MKRKLIAYLLIAIGVLPVALKIVLSVMSETEMTIESDNEKFVNFYNEYGIGILIGGFFIGLLMIVIGSMMLKNEKAKAAAIHDETDLQDGEQLVMKHKSMESIILLTNRRVRYYGYYTKQLKKSVPDCPETDREDYLISQIHRVKPLKTADIQKRGFKLDKHWGVQLLLKDGRAINIPSSSGEELVNRIDILVRQS